MRKGDQNFTITPFVQSIAVNQSGGMAVADDSIVPDKLIAVAIRLIASHTPSQL
jgi:hypothetical protein